MAATGRSALSKEHGVDIMAGQAAPEGTRLRELWKKSARDPEGTEIQAKLQLQGEEKLDKFMLDDIIKTLSLRGKNASLHTKDPSLSAPFTAAIGNPLRRAWLGIRGTHPKQISKKTDKLLQKNFRISLRR